MPIYNLLEYNKNYWQITTCFCNYDRDESNSCVSGASNNINYPTRDLEPFDYKTIITGKLELNNTEKHVEIVVPLKHLSNFWRTLEMPLINCEINLILTWSENFVLANKETRDVDPDVNPAVAVIDNATNATFKITDTKLYVPVVSLIKENDKEFSEQFKTRFKWI